MKILNKRYDPQQDLYERFFRYWDWVAVSNLEKWQQDSLLMLRPLRDVCKDCTMCRLGIKKPDISNKRVEDQHVFSNLKPSKYVVIGQNPGFEECEQDKPFVGEAGRIFDRQIKKNGLLRSQFYITNTVKCATPDNRKPKTDEIDACRPYLMIELRILRPQLVLALGAPAFNELCPDLVYGQSRGKVSKSDKYNVKVFSTYHPSPRNMQIKERKEDFEKHIGLLCKVIKHLESDE